jgi:hypothetical protein
LIIKTLPAYFRKLTVNTGLLEVGVEIMSVVNILEPYRQLTMITK